MSGQGHDWIDLNNDFYLVGDSVLWCRKCGLVKINFKGMKSGTHLKHGRKKHAHHVGIEPDCITKENGDEQTS